MSVVSLNIRRSLRKYGFGGILAIVVGQVGLMTRVMYDGSYLGSTDMSTQLSLQEESMNTSTITHVNIDADRNVMDIEAKQDAEDISINNVNHTQLSIGNVIDVIDVIKEPREYKAGLDFFIVGYPKTGTTSLMNYFNSSDELEILLKSDEVAEFQMGSRDDIDLLFDRLEEKHLGSGKKDRKYGIKWPGAIANKGMGIRSIELLENYNPQGADTKIILGLRHPVKWFESFYNYRAMIASIDSPPPPTESLIGKKKWMGVSTDGARYEEGIMQFGKIPIQIDNKKRRNRILKGLGVIEGGTPYKVFIYLQEQLDDNVESEHKKVFLEEMSSFMELKKPFTIDDDVPMTNSNNHKKHDICEPEHDAVRRVLVENGRETAEWIRTNVVGTEGFVIANKDQFLSIVDTFGSDPCDLENEELDEKSVQDVKEDLNSSSVVKNDAIKRHGGYKTGLDFFIVGFPKTGTSSLMHYFHSSDELEVLPKADDQKEFSMLRKKDMNLLFNRIREKSNNNKDHKYGIKWPNALYANKGIGPKSIELLEKYNPKGTNTKLLIGLRHPVKWFESYYNYRAKVFQKEHPPPTASLIGSNEWMGVSTDAARFEKGILLLGNFPLRQEDKEFFEGNKGKIIKGGTSNKVLVYLQEQLGDDVGQKEKKKFLKEISSFMELKKPFTINDDVPVSNSNNHKQHDICESEHDAVRRVLVENGRKTAEWIRAYLVDTDGFMLANKNQFLRIVDTFGTDPCAKESIA